jgi:hypothetical protein
MKKKLQPYIVVCPRCSSYLELMYTDGKHEEYKCMDWGVMKTETFKYKGRLNKL